MDTLTFPPPVLGQAGTQAPAGPASDETEPRRRRHGPDAFAVGLALLVMLAVVLAVMGAGMLVRARNQTPAQRYRTETVTRGQVTGVLRVPARVVPRSVLRIGADRVGKVVAVNVAPGDRVKRGQVLARLDDRELRALASGNRASLLAARVNAHQAQMRLAQIVYLLERSTQSNRGSALDQDEEALTPQELQAAALDAEVTLVNAAAELKKQSASLAATQASLSNAVLTAPMDGVVLSRAVEPGETVAAGVPLVVLGTDPSEMQVVASLSEGDISRVQPGKATFVVPAFPDRVFQARLGAVEPAIAASTTTTGSHAEEVTPSGYRVRLLAANREQQLQAGMTAIVSIPLASARESLQVPVEAVQVGTGEGGEPHGSVYVLDSARRPQRIPVEVGVTDGRRVEIRSAKLAPGASVILGNRDHELD
jgi:HlyD family secretion protein